MENTLKAHILLNWEQEWDDDERYFVILPNGNALGYDFTTECFYLNNYWNEISYDEAMQMLKVLA
jgi:hypothetical protein